MENENKEETTETTEEVVEVSDEVVEKIASKLTATIQDSVDKAIEKSEGTKTVKKIEGGNDEGGKDELADMGHKLIFAKQMIALTTNDKSTLSRLNKFAIETQKKAGYMNATTDADGGYLVPPADFIADLARLDGEYGVALRDARIRQTNSDSVILIKKAGGVSLYETGEGEAKTTTKMTIASDTITLRKFAGIAPFTDELDEDSAISLYDELVTDFALARNQKADELVFTDATTGVVNVAGVKTVSVGSNVNEFTFDDMADMISSVSRAARRGAKFYISGAVESALRKQKALAGDGNYFWAPVTEGAPGRIMGYPYEVIDVLPLDNAANEAYAVFGNLQWITLVVKRGLDLTLLTEGTVSDGDGGTINLAQQDMKALRAVTRMNARVQLPAAFCVAGTGTVS
jgi:HK97 family phage major capsid protein